MKKGFWFFEGFKYGRLEGLFAGILRISEDVTVLGSLVGNLFGASVGSYEGFKYCKLYGTLFVDSFFCWVLRRI